MVHTMKSERDAHRARRRYHDRAFKEELVRQSLEPGASVSAIALGNGINANMLFKWRKENLRSASRPKAVPAVLLPVEAAAAAEVVTMPAPAAPTSPSSKPALQYASHKGVIELEIGGVQMRVRGAVDEASLCSVLRALHQAR
jgi:transposase